MIDLTKDTPIEYSKQSRDYQVFTFLYNSIFNQAKMYTDLTKNIWTDNIDDKLLDLRARTLNFIPKFQWENNDLLGITNCFRYLLRTKGTASAIQKCLEILSRVHGISLKGVNVQVVADNVVRLIISEEIDDVGNIEDLLRYILPAGMLYEIIKYSEIDSNVVTEIVVRSNFDSERSGTYYKTGELYLPTGVNAPDLPEDYKIPRQISDNISPNILTDYSTSRIVSDETTPFDSDAKFKLTIKKVWDDRGNVDRLRENVIGTIIVNDSIGGTPYETPISGADYSKTSWTVENLPVFTDTGELLTYTITESLTSGDGYEVINPDPIEASVDASKTVEVINRHIPEKKSFTVNVFWMDNDDQDGIRNSSNASVQLWRSWGTSNKQSIGSPITVGFEDWTYTWNDLPSRHTSGEVYNYYVVETIDSTYSSSKTQTNIGENITNTHTPYETKFTLSLVWNDENNRDGLRPGSVDAELFKVIDGAETLLRTESISSSITINEMPVNEDGKRITYRIKMPTVANYSVDRLEISYPASQDDSGSQQVTYTHIPEKVDVNVRKVWDDNDDQDGKRPPNVKVQLYKQVGTNPREAVGGKIILVDNYTWTNLYKKEGGMEIVYSVEEDVPDKYTATYSSDVDSLIITNSYTPAEFSIRVTKVWDDASDQDGKRLGVNAKVQLYANDVALVDKISNIPTTDGDVVTWTVPVYKNGVNIRYKAIEELPLGSPYTKSGDGATIIAREGAGGVVNLKDSYTPETTTVTFTKIWDDKSDNDRVRSLVSAVAVLKADGVEKARGPIRQDADTINIIFGGDNSLPKYKDHGVEIVYTFDEELTDPSGYYTKSSVDNTFTNTHVPIKIQKTLTINWNDDGDRDGLRSGVVTEINNNDAIKLFDSPTPSAVFVSDVDAGYGTDNVYTWTSGDINKYKNGNEINYAFKVGGTATDYSLSLSGDTLTVTHVPAKIKLTVNGTWDDATLPGDRPSNVSLTLVKSVNGVETELETVSVDTSNDTFSYAWNNLFVWENVNNSWYNPIYKVIETIEDDPGYVISINPESHDASTGDGTIEITNTYN